MKIPREELISISSSAVSTLEKKGILKSIQKEDYRMKFEVSQDTKKVLTSSQQKVVDAVIHDTSNKPFLLYGVTGSGKTEVYMHIIEHVL